MTDSDQGDHDRDDKIVAAVHEHTKALLAQNQALSDVLKRLLRRGDSSDVVPSDQRKR